MDLYLLLLLTYITYLFVGLKMYKLDLVSPSMITVISFTLVIFLGYIYREEMETTLYLDTYLVLSVGGGIFLITGIVITKLFERRYACVIPNMEAPQILIAKLGMKNLFRLSCLFLVIFSVLALWIMFYNTSGDSDISRMTQHREYINFPKLYPNKTQFLTVMNQLFKGAFILTYSYIYVCVYNHVIANKPIFKGTGLVGVLILYFIGTSIALGARQPFIESLIFIALSYLFLLYKLERKEGIKKLLMYLIPILVVAPFIYILYGHVVGRTDGHKVSLQRITELLAGGIHSMNVHIFEPARTEYWGQSSFADIYDKIINIGLLPESARLSYHAFDKFGNTVTLYGRWYEDFGFLGVIIMCFLVAAVFTYAYEWLKRQSLQNKKIQIAIILFNIELISLVWAGYDDRIRPLFSLAQMLILLGTAFFMHFMYQLKNSKTEACEEK